MTVAGHFEEVVAVENQASPRSTFTIPSALCSADDAKIRPPRADFIRVLAGEHPRNLHDVIEVMRHPCRQKLPERHFAQFRVPADAVEVRIGQLEGAQLAEVGLPKPREVVEQVGQGSPSRSGELREPVEFVEGARVAVRQDDLRPWDPVDLLTVYQVPHDIEGAPRVFALVSAGPRFRQAAQQRIEGRRRSGENGDGVREHERAPGTVEGCHQSGRTARASRPSVEFA
jgi:hypothetical protein